MVQTAIPSTKVTIRPARPSDAGHAAHLIYSTGPCVIDYIFLGKEKGRVLDYFSFAFADRVGELGCDVHMVAEVDDKVVGIGAGFRAKDTARFMAAGVSQVLRFYKFAGVGVIYRALQVEKVVRPPTGELFVLAHLGVDPGFRSQGIGSMMINHLLSQAATEGYPRAALDVAIDNTRAQELYQRHGFLVADQRVSRYKNAFAEVPDHLRMERNL